MTKQKILVGTPTIKPDQRFLKTLPEFLFQASRKYALSHIYVHGKPLYEAENLIVDRAIKGEFDYLLFLEDDHWGFTLEMLESLVNKNNPFTAIPYYSRHYPYQLTAMKFYRFGDGILSDYPFYKESKHESGFHESDLIGTGFTLICVKLLKALSRPVFYPTKYEKRAVDKYFCNKVWTEFNLKPLVNFNFILPHRDLTKENIMEKKLESLNKKGGVYRFMSQKIAKKNFNLEKFLQEKSKHVLELADEV